MKLLYQFSIIFHCLLITVPSYSDALPSLSSWWHGYSQESWYQEINCSLHPTVHLKTGNGSIAIKTWSQPKIVIKAIKFAKEKDLPSVTIDTQVQEKSIDIHTIYADPGLSGAVDYELMIPLQTNLVIESGQGSIKIKRLEGAMNITTQGELDIYQACNSIKASAQGVMHIRLNLVPLNSSLILQSDRDIFLQLPPQTNAELYAVSEKHAIESEHFITLRPFTTKLNQETWNHLRKEIRGRIGNGGAIINLSAHGNVKLLELQ